jgi:NAD(P)-dependent dehydrogenase (short-subunit alcohol dehydrogenase family)
MIPAAAPVWWAAVTDRETPSSDGPARFDGRRALVTGGGSGIGAATARLLQARGARVAVLDQSDPADVVADVRDAAAVDVAVEAACGVLGGPPDVLVASAGIYRIQPFLEIEAAAWDEVLDVNLRGVFLTGQAVARRLAADGLPGAIVNLASIAALTSDASEPSAHYNASKAGVVALTRQMAVELAPHGIRVNCVCPGVVDTPMLRLMDDPEAGGRYLRESVPLGRLARPDEVARAICFLASSEASYVTGAAVPIDGGSTLL